MRAVVVHRSAYFEKTYITAVLICKDSVDRRYNRAVLCFIRNKLHVAGYFVVVYGNECKSKYSKRLRLY